MIEFRLPMKTRSLNTSFRGGWQPRAAKTKRERNRAMAVCPKWPGGPLMHVRLTRVSKGTLDRANLAGALKSVQDGVASRLRVDDASPLVDWHFEQAKGEAEVVVQIWTAGEDAPPVPVGNVHPSTARSAGRAARKPVRSYTPPRSKPVDAAKEAEETFAPGAEDMTEALGPGPHPEHYDCSCAPCVGEWGAR